MPAERIALRGPRNEVTRSNARHPADPIPPDLLAQVLAERGGSYGFRMILIGSYFATQPFAQLAKHHGLLRDEFTVLGILSDYGDMSANVICAMSGRPKNSISRGVIRLTERNLIGGHVSPEDRRRVILSVAPEGRRIYAEALSLFDSRDQDMFGGLDAQELQQLDTLLAKVLAQWHRRR
jgi:DNA-binding MarR family transcriptional regulator